ncbi:acyloxyacyl hydrolase [Brumimicrobium aurantiacum]|uniref:Acyloxyacyl hydrolase n=1 Tax=Brumimicrobium aurantiacum TaxID=1737063 RepID=A0A3E1EUX3_9FLAO|nr:acyloxyacyl hydrolase [Brumimicrobium aurantiacum]RFC53340.1 hypothetical protein DXU93_12980 [Brumimicrobium aurantiacum]
MKFKVLQLLVCILGLFQVPSLAQYKNFGLTGTGQIGYLMPHRSTMAHLNTGHSYGGRLGVVFQSDGSKVWQQNFNFPKAEINVFFLDLGNKEVLGNSFGVSTNVFLPFHKSTNWRVGSALGFGLGWVSKTYDVVTNKKNNVIGSHLNCLVNLGLRLEKQFQQNALGFELSMTHLSNGAFKLPNLGLNMPYLSFNYSHFLQPVNFESKAKIEDEIIFPLKTWAFYTQFTGSLKEIYPTGGKRYGVAAFTNFLQYRFNTKAIVEAAFETIYNSSIVPYSKLDYGSKYNFQLGLYGGYVLPIHDFKMLIAMGSYVLNPIDPAGIWFHKLGIRYQISDHFLAHFAIKSHWAKADYFEYGVIYKWK